MKNIFLVVATVIVVLFALSFQSFAQFRPPSRQTQQIDRSPSLEPLPADLLRKLQTIPNRATQLNALMAKPTTKAQIESIARSKKMSVSQLSTMSLDAKLVSSAPIVLNPGISCPNVNWTAGVKLTPFTAPPLCRGPWGPTSLGMTEMYILNANTPVEGDMFLSSLSQRNIFPMHSVGSEMHILVRVMLQPIRATYLITIHAVPRYSANRLSEYLGESPAFQAGYQSANANDTGNREVKLDLTPLADESGFVGIMSTDITPAYQAIHPFVYIDLRLTRMKLIFGGITITQL